MSAQPESLHGDASTSAFDTDAQETREWLEALDSLTAAEGPERAHFLLEKLIEEARHNGIAHPFSATTPYIVCGSSPERMASVSKVRITSPPGELPRVVNGLYLSKLVRRSGFFRRSVPPLGAAGSAYSKCVKSGPYFGSP